LTHVPRPIAEGVSRPQPNTPNGKVDRQALPAPGHTRPALETPFMPPRTPIEQQLAGSWAALLAHGLLVVCRVAL
jgi:hypothetical protein